MPYWENDVLMVQWFGADKPCRLGQLLKNTNKRKAQQYKFVADTIGDKFVAYYYHKPAPQTVVDAFLNWQLGA